MPLGGIGTGNVAICGDGALRQWQLHNLGNHRGELPFSFFALRATQWEPPLDVVRVLQAPPAPSEQTRTPLVDDDHVPDWQRELLGALGGVETTTFRATYPVAQIDYHDDALPVRLSLEAFTPMVPLDVDRSSLPAAMFTFTVTNDATVDVHGWLGAAAQNPVGHDGATTPDGVHGPGYGGNTNRVRHDAGWTALVMDNAGLDPLAPGAGQLVLSADSLAVRALPQWTHPKQFLGFLRGLPHVPAGARTGVPAGSSIPLGPPVAASEPSPPGTTWNGGLAAPFELAPGATARIRMLLTWHFPNRYVDFPQFGPNDPRWGPTRFWLGNHYATVHADAEAVSAQVRDSWDELSAMTQTWTDTLRRSALDRDAVEHLSAQAVSLRSPTCFRAADGSFFGFEGVLGASTGMWSGDVGGSCPLNCTHVWNYEHALSRLFPTLERNMRETEFEILQAPDGSIPHRVLVPTYLRQRWGEPIGGPLDPALDGMLGTVLKTYREVRLGAGLPWLATVWPRLTRVLDHIRGGWDPDSTGVLRGAQPATHDVDLFGVNTFMGTLWLAALRAGQRLAALVGEHPVAQEWGQLFERGSTAYDDLLFNGEYYEQRLDPDDPAEHAWGTGCLSDQLIGQWWAHLLDLGHLLPREHVREALRSIVRFNLRDGFDGFDHPFRSFAVDDDRGLLVCSWPRGGRPAVPIRYADEVWSGTEYQVAAHCRLEGLVDESDAILAGLWERYDGRRRNPYNEVECGDHYVRSMAGWTVLEAMTGQRWNALTRNLRMRRPPVGSSWPVLLDRGWGELADVDGQLELRCHHGAFDLASLRLLDGEMPPSDDTEGEPADTAEEMLAAEVYLAAGDRLRLAVPEHVRPDLRMTRS
jgi:uncharacterized protein (DUF608 family)